MRHSCIAFLVGIVLVVDSAAFAEFVQLEPVAAQVAQRVAPLLKDKSVVVAARWIERAPLPWAVHRAAAVELTAALRARGINAVRAATHPATKALDGGTSEFSSRDARRAGSAGRDLLLAVTVSMGRNQPRLEARVLRCDGKGVVGETGLQLPRACFDLDANVPELNRRVVKFCQHRLGSAVGDGVCWTLAAKALKAAGAKRSGLYAWGRELAAGEPLLPGDILQLEQAKLKTPRRTRAFPHHTAVVEEVRPDGIVVLQQNVDPLGKVVQRDTWPTSAKREGIMRAYRPWLGESPLAPVSPRRRKPPRVVRRGNIIDLLRTLDPRLDSVRGIWFFDGGLQCNSETYARLQVPVEPPRRYTLRLKARRSDGDDQLGVGLIVGGHQTMLSIDSYGGKKTGLHFLDGKSSRNNESTHTGQVLPLDAVVELTVRVRPNSVRLWADGKTIVDWSGDPARLRMDKDYAMPRGDWLFLSSWRTQWEVTEFTLEEE
jgi:hypothetical protein